MAFVTGKEMLHHVMYMYTEGVMAVVQYCYFAITMEGSLAGESMSFRIIPMQILVCDVSYAAWT